MHVLHADAQYFKIADLSQKWPEPFEHRVNKTRDTVNSTDGDQNRLQENKTEMSKTNELSRNDSHTGNQERSIKRPAMALVNTSCCPICPLSIAFAKEYWRLEDNTFKFESSHANIKVEESYESFGTDAAQEHPEMEACHGSSKLETFTNVKKKTDTPKIMIVAESFEHRLVMPFV